MDLRITIRMGFYYRTLSVHNDPSAYAGPRLSRFHFKPLLQAAQAGMVRLGGAFVALLAAKGKGLIFRRQVWVVVRWVWDELILNKKTLLAKGCFKKNM